MCRLSWVGLHGLVVNCADFWSLDLSPGWVWVSLGSQLRKTSSAYGWSGIFLFCFLEYSSFCPPLIKDLFDLSEKPLKGHVIQVLSAFAFHIWTYLLCLMILMALMLRVKFRNSSKPHSGRGKRKKTPTHWERLECKVPRTKDEFFFFQGDREGFETYYRRQRRKQARLSLQPPSNMVCLF